MGSCSMASSVGPNRFMSCTLAASTATASGTPRASTRRLRLAPHLARSVGLGPVLFSPQRRLGHCPIHREETPVDAHQFIVRLHPAMEETLEGAVPDPLAEAVVGGG